MSLYDKHTEIEMEKKMAIETILKKKKKEKEMC